MKRICILILAIFSVLHAQSPFGNVLRINDVDQCAINSSAYLAPGATQIGPPIAMNTMNGPITIEFLYHTCTNPDSTGYGVLWFSGNSTNATMMGADDWDVDPLSIFSRMYIQSLGVDAYEGMGGPYATGFTSMGWHHIVFEFTFDYTYDRNVVHVGFDGAPLFTNPLDNTNTNAWKGFNFSIGKLTTGLGILNLMPSMKGSYDEVRITNGARYNLGGTLPGGHTLTVPTAEFVTDASTYALWHFNELPGDTIMQDASGNNFDMRGINGAMVVSPVSSGNLYATSVDSVCYGGLVNLTGANNFSWSPSYGLSGSYSNPTALLNDTAVTYLLHGLDINTCNIYYDSLTLVGLGGNLFTDDTVGFCAGNTVTLDAGSGYMSYTWSTGATTQSIFANTPGMYYVDVNTSTCTFSDSIFVEDYPAITVSLGPDVYSCLGDTVHIDPIVTGSPVSYTWSTGVPSTFHTIWIPGDTISIIVTDVNGCTANDTLYSFSGSNHHIDGVIHTHDAMPFVFTKVYAVTFDTTLSELIVVDSTSTNLYGEYDFNPVVLPLGIMVVPDTGAYPNEAPTYHFGTYVYHHDSTLNFSTCVDTSLSFYAIEMAAVSGTIDIPGIFIIGGRAIGDPIPNAKLILVNNLGQPVQIRKTNSAGQFNFADLTPGQYWFWADLPYIDNSLAPSITVTNADSAIEYIKLGEFVDHLEIMEIHYMGVEDEKIPMVTFAYPNPADDILYINNPTSKELNVSVYNALGQKMTQLSVQNNLNVDCSEWPASVYYIEFRSGSELIGLQKILIR